MLIVIPVCAKDVSVAIENLKWCNSWGIKESRNCLISVEDGTEREPLEVECKKYFNQVTTWVYDKYEGKPEWPKPQNFAWQAAARRVPICSSESWFWWESDVTPIHAGWLDALDAGYLKGGQPFMGHVVPSMGHMNGVAVYPNNVAHHTTDALMVRSTPFDTMLWKDIEEKVHPANHLIAHFPRYNGCQLTFNDKAPARMLKDSGFAIFHGVRDGSLIKQLKCIQSA